MNKNYISEALKKFMEDHGICPNEKFMLFENNTGDDTYYGTYRVNAIDTIKNILNKTTENPEYTLECLKFPTLLEESLLDDEEDKETDKIAFEMLSGEYEVRKIRNDEPYGEIYVFQEHISDPRNPDRTDDLYLYDKEEKAVSHLRIWFHSMMCNEKDEEEKAKRTKKFNHNVAHGIYMEQYTYTDEDNFNINYTATITKLQVNTK